MSVGHVAREVERSGIATVSVYVSAFRHVAGEMSLPRTVITNHPFGRPLGPAHRPQRHAAVVAAALDLVETAETGPAIAEMPGGFAAGDGRLRC